MELKEYIRFLTPEERQAFAVKANTSVGYLYQLAGGHRKAGALLAKNIEIITSRRVKAVDLRPDIFGK